MRRFIVSTTVALGCAFTVAIHAQDTTMKSKTNRKSKSVLNGL